MAKKGGTRSRGSIIGVLGGILVGAAILLFVTMQILIQLKTAIGQSNMPEADKNTTNATIDTLITFLGICVVLLGVLGIAIIGSHIIGYIGAGFGG